MSYRKILEQYVKNELDEAMKNQVEEDIEKQSAISEYLFDQEEMADYPVKMDLTGIEPDEVHGGNGFNAGAKDGGDDRCDNEAEEFIKRIHCAIRKAFIKAGVVVVAITIAIVLFLLFGLPNLVSEFYYNPGQIIESTEELNSGNAMNQTNQMSLDMMIYTDLFMPYNPRQSVKVVDNGYGSYDVSIGSFYYFSNSYEELVGKVEQEVLTLYNPSAFKQAPGNVFGWFQQTPTMDTSLREIIKEDIYDESTDSYKSTYMAASGTREQATETLESLQENKNYVAYVTLDELMKYEDFMALEDKYQCLHTDWVSVVYEDIDGQTMLHGGYGFDPMANSSSVIYWDEEKYPELWTWTSKYEEESSEAYRERRTSEDYMKVHFTSMLSYMQDQKAFCEMMDVNYNELQQVKTYVQEHGIIVQGFAVRGTKEELLRINDMDEVYAMYVAR